MATYQPLSDAVKLGVSALFGDPEAKMKMTEMQELRRMNDAKIAQAEAAAALDRDKLQALQNSTQSFTDLLAPVRTGARELSPQEFGPQAPLVREPKPEEISSRLPDFLGTGMRSGAISASNLGEALQAVEGMAQNLTVTDPNIRQRNAAFGAGSPYSTDELDAQTRANLPTEVQQSLASALSTDEAMGGALVRTRTDEKLASLAESKINDGGKRTVGDIQAELQTRLLKGEQLTPIEMALAQGNKKSIRVGADGAVTVNEGVDLGGEESAKIKNRAQNVLYASQRMQDLITNTNIGLASDTQQFVNGLNAQAGAILQAVGTSQEDLNARYGLVVDPSNSAFIKQMFDDPSLGPVDFLTVSLAYALAGLNDPSGRVSDADFRSQLKALQAGAFTSPQALLSTLNEVDRLALQRMDNAGVEVDPALRERILSFDANKKSGPSSPQPPSGAAPTTAAKPKYKEGQTATLPNGSKVINRGGKWYPLN